MKKILFVCYGNICRSPAAEGVFTHLIKHRYPQVRAIADSAGTHDFHVGKQPDARSVYAAAKKGIDLSTLKARMVSETDFEHFDRVVFMDPFNSECLHQVCPPSLQHKLVALSDHHPDLNYKQVPDPFRGTLADFDHMIDSMVLMVDALIQNLMLKNYRMASELDVMKML